MTESDTGFNIHTYELTGFGVNFQEMALRTPAGQLADFCIRFLIWNAVTDNAANGVTRDVRQITAQQLSLFLDKLPPNGSTMGLRQKLTDQIGLLSDQSLSGDAWLKNALGFVRGWTVQFIDQKIIVLDQPTTYFEPRLGSNLSIPTIQRVRSFEDATRKQSRGQS